jgi:rubrerythrin
MSRTLWWAWGWIFWRHWITVTHKLYRREWYRRVVRWLRSTKDALVKHPIRHRAYLLLDANQRSLECPHCGYECWTEHEDLFVLRRSGGDSWCGYWFEGDQTCARCGTTHEYADGS